MSSRASVRFLCLVMLVGGIAGSAACQSRSSGSIASGSLSKTDASDETTVEGVISEVLMEKPEGAPWGLNFVMTGSRRTLTVNVGHVLSSRVKELIKAGETIKVRGVVRSFSGQNYLMAREVVAGGQTILLHNSNGFPVRANANGTSQPKHVESDLRGGAR